MEKTREEVSNEYKWDLSTVYKSNKELDDEYKKIKTKIISFKEHENTFLKNANNLYETLKEFYNINMKIEKMYVFVSHRYDTDITNNENKASKEKIKNLYNDFSINSSFLIPRLQEFGYDNIKKYMKENTNLKEEYDFIFEDIFRYEKYTLSLKEEKLLSSLSKAISNPSSVSNMLQDSDLDFGTIKDEEGKNIKLTDTNYSIYIQSKDRNVRKRAFKKLYKTYKQFNNTFSLLLSSYVDKNRSISKIRGYKSSLEASLFDDNVSVDVYNNLISVVNENLDKLYKYYDLKKEILKLKDMHLYDIYVDISKKESKKYTFDEAKELIINSLEILGEDYIENLKKAFAEKWIDIYPNKGKRGGAYSGGAYLTNPFLLLNFNGLYHDVSTLAHELGHSMHSYYSCKNNPYQYSNYQIFVAEVASQVNELLFNNYMLGIVKTKDEKINILNQILELFKGSIYRQTMFAEFEKEIAEKQQNNIILTADVLNEIYLNLVKKYFGDNVIIDKEITYEWQRVPHFYYNFYVYKYSTGLAAAAYIAKNILDKKENALENYLAFLKTGGSDYPLNELLIADVDLTKKEVIQSALDMFGNYLNELEKLVK